MTGPLVSVVIPCHGHARYLGDAIVSAQRQTHEAIEVVVVDDGSPDDTAEVASRHDGVVLVRQANAGLSAARNAGLAAASGDLVVFLDADDRLRPDGVAAGVRELEAQPAFAFVAGSHVRVDDAGHQLPVSHGHWAEDDDAYTALLRSNWIGMHAAVLYRREAVEEAGGFEPSLDACEDYDLYLRIARLHPIGRHGHVVAEYRRHGANLSDDVALMMAHVLVVLGRQLPHVVDDAERFAALREGLWNFSTYYLGEDDPDDESTTTGREILTKATAVGRRVAVRASREVRDRVREAVARRSRPAVGEVDLGDLRRLEPISREFGYDRGTPVDRVFIEGFLERWAADVRGRVLEIGDATYTRRFGGAAVTAAEVLHVVDGGDETTYVGTLEDGSMLPSDAFDCVVLTQTLHLIVDVRAALRTVERILKPGGVLLLTVPGISQISTDQWSETWSWAMTPHGIGALIAEAMPACRAEVGRHGNVLTSVAFLHGLAAEELRPDELAHEDPAFPMLVTARVVKGGTAGA